MSDLRRLAGYLLRHRWALAGAIVAALAASTFLGGSIALVNPLIESFVSSQSAPAATSVAAPAPAGDAAKSAPGGKAAAIEQVLPGWAKDLRSRWRRAIQPAMDWMLARGYRIPLIIVVLYSLKALLFFVGDYTFRRVGLQATATLRQELYARSLQQSDVFFLRHSTGEMISRILGDVARLQSTLGADIGQMLQSIPTAAVSLVVAFLESWQITLACLVALPVFGYAAAQLGRRAKKGARRSQEQAAVLVAQIEEALIGRRVVQAYGAEDHENRRFGETIGRNLRQEYRVARASSATPATMEIIGALAIMLIVAFGAVLSRAGAIDPKSIPVVVIALGFAFTHVKRIAQLNTIVQQALAAAHRVFEVLDEPVAVQDPPDPRTLPPFSSEIRFEAVHFDYGRGPVIHGVDLAVRTGEIHALVGPSGAGKSTLAMMIPRFIDPTAGRVMIDGLDLRAVALGDLRRQIALVTQETHLFDDTVRANIAYSRPEADQAAIEGAARAAHADDFIRQLPQGYDTPLGERGTQLSAGQRQRIAIARAFLKDAPILILDEATSALDSAAEREVQNALDALLAGRTALIIAHRLSTVARAARIHVLDGGRIVESGRHDELLEAGGAYARLHQLQRT